MRSNYSRILNLGLFLSFMICYLEWGGGNNGFIFQMEYEVIRQLFSGGSVLHPLTILPFAGQILLLITLFQRTPNRRLTILSMILLGSLVLMILLVGILSLNLKILFSVLPFLIFSYLIIKLRAVVNTHSGYGAGLGKD